MKKNIEKRYYFENIELRKDDAGEDAGIGGYASVFYNGKPESQYDIFDGAVERIDPHAFDSALNRDDVRGLFNHDPNQLLGRNRAGTLKLKIDERGLKYDIDLPDTQAGKDVSVLLNRGDLTGSSFSFIPQAVEWSKEGDLEVRTIKDVRLLDVGPVTYPAYDGATSFARDTTEAEDELAKIEAEKKEAEAKAQAEADAEEKKKADEEAEKLKADQEAQADLDYADSSITSHKD